MRLKNIYGRLVYKNVRKYLIDWDKKSKSKLQFELKQYLKQYWINSMVYEEFPVYGTLMHVDFVNISKKIAIEFSPKSTHEYNKFFHREDRNVFLSSIKRDLNKVKWLLENDFLVLELNEEDLKKFSRNYIIATFGIDIA